MNDTFFSYDMFSYDYVVRFIDSKIEKSAPISIRNVMVLFVL